MKLTYEAILNDPSLLERVRMDAHRERAEAMHQLIVEPIRRKMGYAIRRALGIARSSHLVIVQITRSAGPTTQG